MSIHAQRRFLWSGFWLLPTVEVVKAGGTIYSNIGLLWWYWEVELSSRWLWQYSGKSFRVGPSPTVLIQASQSLHVKFFFGRWYYDWWVMSLRE